MYVSQERLITILNYDPITGIFLWKDDRGNGSLGKSAGMVDAWGYIQIRVDGKKYLAHRLVWLYMTGSWPRDQIDHINGDKIDNCFANLREATATINTENRHRARRDNKSGFLGVTYRKECRKSSPWLATIQVCGKLKRLGRFSTPEEAHEAYLCAKKKLHKGYVELTQCLTSTN